MSASAEFVSPFTPGSHTHGWSLTCLVCQRGELFVLGGYGPRAVLRTCEEAARQGGWTKTKDGWAHKLCVELRRRHLSGKQIRAVVPGPEPLPPMAGEVKEESHGPKALTLPQSGGI